MSDGFISDDLINAIENLEKLRSNHAITTSQDHHPIISIVRPEWYLSESTRILDDIDITWESLNFDRRNDLINDINNVDTDSLKDLFERTSSVWYQSYHFNPRSQWGIHIRYDSWLRTAKRFMLHISSFPFLSGFADSLKFGFIYLYNHALFHYLVENAASIIEIVSNKPNLYSCYYKKIYLSHVFSDDCLEEILANQYLIYKFKLFNKNLSDILRIQNKMTHNVEISELDFNTNIRELLLQIKDCMVNPISTDPIEQIIGISSPIDRDHRHRIPIWLHKGAMPLDKTYTP